MGKVVFSASTLSTLSVVVAAMSFAQAQPVITVLLAALAMLVPLCARWIALELRARISHLERSIATQPPAPERAELAAELPPEEHPQ